MGRGPNRSPQERRTLYLLEMAGLTHKQVNEIMKARGFRPVPLTTYKMNMSNERLLFLADPSLLNAYSRSPVPYGHWPVMWKKMASEARGNGAAGIPL